MNNWLRRKVVAWLAPEIERRRQERNDRLFKEFFVFRPNLRMEGRDLRRPTDPEAGEGQAI